MLILFRLSWTFVLFSDKNSSQLSFLSIKDTQCAFSRAGFIPCVFLLFCVEKNDQNGSSKIITTVLHSTCVQMIFDVSATELNKYTEIFK